MANPIVEALLGLELAPQDEQIRSAVGQAFVPAQSPKESAMEMLRRMQLNLDAGRVGNQYSNTRYLGGRFGYEFPIGEGNLNAGVSGNGSKTKVNVPGYRGTERNYGLSGADAAYTSGPNTYGVDYQNNDDEKMLNLFYRRDF